MEDTATLLEGQELIAYAMPCGARWELDDILGKEQGMCRGGSVVLERALLTPLSFPLAPEFYRSSHREQKPRTLPHVLAAARGVQHFGQFRRSPEQE